METILVILFIFALQYGKLYSCMLKQVEFLPRIRINVLQPPVPFSKIYDFTEVRSFNNFDSC